MQLSRVFAVVGAVFGTVFVVVNAPSLPSPWHTIGLAVGLALLAVALVVTFTRRLPTGEEWTGSARAYWVAVGAEAVAIPAGALVLTQVLDEPDLVVLWVVLVVGAHFLPAYAFGIGRYAELGLVLIAIAVVFGAISLSADADWAPRGGAVLAGCTMLGSVATGSLGGHGRTPREGRDWRR